MTLGANLVIVAIAALMAALPTWGYGDLWSYGPVGVLGILLVLLIVLARLQKI